jgi:hypothetical protein
MEKMGKQLKSSWKEESPRDTRDISTAGVKSGAQESKTGFLRRHCDPFCSYF